MIIGILFIGFGIFVMVLSVFKHEEGGYNNGRESFSKKDDFRG